MDNDSGPVPTYTPIMRQILDSSVWEAEPKTRVLWITMLVIASEPGRRGTVDMTLRALAGRACLPVEDTVAALAALSAPDPTSRTKADEGRRICRIDPDGREWGWRIVNWEKYAKAQERMHAAARSRTFRRKQKEATTTRGASASPLRTVARTTERKGKDRKGEREETTENEVAPSLQEAATLWAGEGLRGSAERYFYYRRGRGGWKGIESWEDDARAWSADQRVPPSTPEERAAEEWGKGRPDYQAGQPQGESEP